MVVVPCSSKIRVIQAYIMAFFEICVRDTLAWYYEY